MAGVDRIVPAGERSRSSRMVLAHPNANAHDAVAMSPARILPDGGHRADPAGSRQELLSSHWGMEHPHAHMQEQISENPTRLQPQQEQGNVPAGERSRSSRMVLAHPNANAHDAVAMSPARILPDGGHRADPAGSRQELLSSHWGMEHPHPHMQEQIS